MPRQHSSISTIIPCYKSEAWLADCLDSISRQSLPPCRVCCVFDGRDHAAESIASDHPVVTDIICREAKSGGAAIPRNQGWQLLQGSADYFHFLDCDDVLHQDYYRTTCDFLDSHSQYSAVWTSHASFLHLGPTPTWDTRQDVQCDPQYTEWTLRDHSPLISPSFMLVRGSALDLLRHPNPPWLGNPADPSNGPQELMEDTEFFFRLLLKHCRVAHISFQGGYYRITPGSVSDNAYKTHSLAFNAFAMSLRPLVANKTYSSVDRKTIHRLAAAAARMRSRACPSLVEALCLLASDLPHQKGIANKFHSALAMAIMLAGLDRKRKSFHFGSPRQSTTLP